MMGIVRLIDTIMSDVALLDRLEGRAISRGRGAPAEAERGDRRRHEPADAGGSRRHQGAQSAGRCRRRLRQAAARRRAPGRAVPDLRRPRHLAALRDPRQRRELGLRGVSGWRRRHPPGREGRGLRFPHRDRAARRPRAVDPAQAKRLFEAREKNAWRGKRPRRSIARPNASGCSGPGRARCGSTARPAAYPPAAACSCRRAARACAICHRRRTGTAATSTTPRPQSPRMIHSGPAMLAAFIRPDGTFGGLHMTWLTTRDVDAAAQAEIIDPETARCSIPRRCAAPRPARTSRSRCAEAGAAAPGDRRGHRDRAGGLDRAHSPAGRSTTPPSGPPATSATWPAARPRPSRTRR
jgi:hypothetical protein